MGGGMKKTYFLDEQPTASQVVKWIKKYSGKKVKILREKIEDDILEQKRINFLKENAKQFIRVSELPKFHVKIKWEMNGKFGWFESQSKYTLPEYVSGWSFENEEKLNEYNKLK